MGAPYANLFIVYGPQNPILIIKAPALHPRAQMYVCLPLCIYAHASSIHIRIHSKPETAEAQTLNTHSNFRFRGSYKWGYKFPNMGLSI